MQTNFTDPQAKIMKTANKEFDYWDNAQLVVDEEHQIIVAAEVTRAANDKQQARPMREKTLENLEAAQIGLPREKPRPDGEAKKVPLCGDNGYFSEHAVRELEARGFDPHFAMGRQQHHAALPVEGEGLPPAAAVKEQTAYKLRTAEGHQRCTKLKQIVEPRFGQIKHSRGFRQFLLRGLRKVSAEWKLLCLTHNLLKIWRYQDPLT